jgi:hypothetical protein
VWDAERMLMLDSGDDAGMPGCRGKDARNEGYTVNRRNDSGEGR